MFFNKSQLNFRDRILSLFVMLINVKKMRISLFFLIFFTLLGAFLRLIYIDITEFSKKSPDIKTCP